MQRDLAKKYASATLPDSGTFDVSQLTVSMQLVLQQRLVLRKDMPPDCEQSNSVSRLMLPSCEPRTYSTSSWLDGCQDIPCGRSVDECRRSCLCWTSRVVEAGSCTR